MSIHRPFGSRRVPHQLLAILVALVVGGCAHLDWVVLVHSDASTDLIVRVEWAGGSRDALIPAYGLGDVIVLRDAQPPARIFVLDPTTCDVLASGDLPTVPTMVGFSDTPVSRRFELGISGKDVRPDADLLPADPRCVGR